MSVTVVGVFDRTLKAEDVIGELQQAGVDRNQISLLVSSDTGASAANDDSKPNHIAGTGAGAAIGGIAGLVVGLAASAIPGIGPILAAGPIAAALGSIGIGAAAGGLIGSLTGMHIPEEDAHYYAGEVRRGRAVVLVNTSAKLADRVRDVLNLAGARSVDERSPETFEEAQLERSSEPDTPQITGSGARIYVGGLELDPRKTRFEDFK